MSMDAPGGSSSGSKIVKPPTDDDDDDADVPSDDEDDEAYADADDEYDREGLQARYQAAGEAAGNSVTDQASFAKYLYSQRG